ncbi:peptidase T, partial [Escherichia coli]|nr:peptidase T [Escherichia coli]
ERFINYTKINTTTSRENGAKGIMPSSPGQMKLAKLLVSELEALGMEDIILRENAIVTATLPANTDETIPVVSFFGHLDTSAEQTADT